MNDVSAGVVPTIAWSDFARNYCRVGTGNSYSLLSDESVLQLVKEHWHLRKPGSGETDTNRKVLVPVPPENFICPPKAPLVQGLPVKARVVQRQEGEDPYIETYVTPEDAERFGVKPIVAKRCDIVCYSAEALLENDGKRSSECDWEIVTILAYPTEQEEPIPSLTMARNFLEKAGGTFTNYTAKEFAESIYYHSTKKMIAVKGD